MAYQFQEERVASLKIADFRDNITETLSISNVNGAVSSADAVIEGLSQFLGIVGLDESFEPTKVTRVVNQRVVAI